MNDVTRLTGSDVLNVLDELAHLRIQVFREFPYLYDGDLTHERDYLQSYADSPNAVVVIARNQGRVIGASTGLPLIEAEAEFQAPFDDPENWFYFGESVLLPEFRGQGLGHAFFDHREAHASEYRQLCFCAVDRSDSHPLRPKNYRNLHAFWQGRGYQQQPQLTANFKWQDLDQPAETDHNLIFWTRTR